MLFHAEPAFDGADDRFDPLADPGEPTEADRLALAVRPARGAETIFAVRGVGGRMRHVPRLELQAGKVDRLP